MKIRLLDLYCGAGGCAVGYSRAGFDVVGVDLNPMPRYPFEFHQGDALDYLREHGHEFDVIHASPPCQAYCSLKSMPNAKVHPDLVAPTREALEATGKPYVIENVPGAPLLSPTMLCGTMFGLGTGDADLRRHRLFETNWSLVLPFGMFCKHGRRAAQNAPAREDRERTICVIGQAGIAEDRALRRIDFKPRVISVHDSSGRGHDEAANHRRRKTITVAGSHGDAGLSLSGQKRPGTVGVRGNAGGQSKRDGLLYFSTAERNEAMGIEWMKGGEISQAIPPAYTKFIGDQLMAFVGAAKVGVA